jgi:hypothetical protein
LIFSPATFLQKHCDCVFFTKKESSENRNTSCYLLFPLGARQNADLMILI